MSLGACPEREVLCDTGPFAGLTEENAQIINGVLIGRRVIAAGGKFEREAREYVFGGVVLVEKGIGGFWPVVGPCAPGDLMLWEWKPRRVGLHIDYPNPVPHGFHSSTWVISPQLLTLFHVCREPELSPCGRCGGWYAQSDLRDDAWYGPEFRSDLVCRACWTDDGGPDLWLVR